MVDDFESPLRRFCELRTKQFSHLEWLLLSVLIRSSRTEPVSVAPDRPLSSPPAQLVEIPWRGLVGTASALNGIALP
ncbi:hypothetical protein RRG08_047717 [Elysia crispata]|uniref:Uncharacterized protein n=1 Tax=Elysia crispata TaxID=231223 RepID=A0AAE1A923_9GAST|nr:hypothetical protein RRG08_047717 [Elysia crispata]